MRNFNPTPNRYDSILTLLCSWYSMGVINRRTFVFYFAKHQAQGTLIAPRYETGIRL